ncbi:peptide-methionine (S)-S-oxide reductase MsrA [Hydrogenimonas cancrithermarum]|uniref:Peptide methionine sulfoxide reductase MsrA n=1 Tax=Hydrogenimonas cancrithermarum TaxID=2993563 RepID=A0ABM8FHR6_9BACT|nr:peptide-methionine (S)-S-oxide reductase MsrA [Hydrogenimonas cancrithermarum]BDY11819.1 peptide methionine sulfoxide reductase MsrA [Hydrogenimonas cancrithermarum]
MSENYEKATFGGGCFWCLEAVFENVKGVEDVVSGYTGGHIDNPSYEAVCSGSTRHAEVVQITYDPNVVSYRELLDIFWKIHDPTTLNRQGADTGTQYRSAIFYHDDGQKRIAEASRQEVQKHFSAPIVTEIVTQTKFWPAEAYHQDYFRNNPYHGYCQAVVAPKVEKFKHHFKEWVKP